jgi:hypothetical protein
LGASELARSLPRPIWPSTESRMWTYVSDQSAADFRRISTRESIRL